MRRRVRRAIGRPPEGRQGGKRLEDAQGGWGDVLAAFDFWATELRRVLAEARERDRVQP